jgi:hypothetical protein
MSVLNLVVSSECALGVSSSFNAKTFSFSKESFPVVFILRVELENVGKDFRTTISGGANLVPFEVDIVVLFISKTRWRVHHGRNLLDHSTFGVPARIFRPSLIVFSSDGNSDVSSLVQNEFSRPE